MAITFLKTVLVLAGAFTAGIEQRIREAMIKKTLGATRLSLLRSLDYEYLNHWNGDGAILLRGGSLAGYAIVKNGTKMPAQPYRCKLLSKLS